MNYDFIDVSSYRSSIRFAHNYWLDWIYHQQYASVSEHTSEASDINQTSNVSYFTSYILRMIAESPFPHSLVRTLAQNVANDMRAVSDQIADTADPIARDELLSQLMLFQGALSLITLASIREDRFFIQRAVDLLRANWIAS